MDIEPPKSDWGPGPWQQEEDRYEWRVGKLPTLITRGFGGNFCGYVGVHFGHPWYGKHYDSMPAEAHGGLSYSAHCSGGICHEPAAHEDGDVWWVGFDCGHAGDLSPAMVALLRRISPTFREGRTGLFRDGKYRDVAYVRAEVEQLAKQAAFAATPVGRALFAYAQLVSLRRELTWWNIRYHVRNWFAEMLDEAEAERQGLPFDRSHSATALRKIKRIAV